MRNIVRLALAGMVAALALGTMVAGASANRLSSSSQNLRVIWSSLIFENTARNARILCPVTLEGTFHSKTIVKTIGSLIGFITRASIKGALSSTECTGGTATILSASLPWHITYQGYKTALPTFGGVILLLVGPAFQVKPTGSLACLARTEARRPAQGIANVEAGGRVRSLQPEKGKTIPLTGEGGLCGFGGEGDFGEEEVGTVTNEAGAGVTITLI